MKYTLTENAISSFYLAIQNFKKFFYLPELYKPSELDETRKLCAIFLENAIELLLKAILVQKNELSIYIEPESKKIKKAKTQATKINKPIEDILIESGSFQTISYTQTIKIFNEIVHSERLEKTFNRLGIYRNQLTHFGIYEENDNEFTICCLETFSIVYQDLYKYLIKFDDISHYFTDDEIIVSTIHGEKKLFDSNKIYNNIIDFLDELVEITPCWCLEKRLENKKFNIHTFYCLFIETIKSQNFEKLLNYYNINIELHNSTNILSVDIIYNNQIYDSIFSLYSSYDNATTFIGESSVVYFRILHSYDKVVIYYEDIYMPDPMEHQYEECDWKKHINCEIAKEYSLSKKNLRLIFEKIFNDAKKIQ